MQHDVDVEVVERPGDQVAEPQLVGEGRLARRDLEPQVEIAAPEMVRDREPNTRCACVPNTACAALRTA